MQPVDLFICSTQDWANDLTSKLVKATSLERFLITSLTRLFSESNVAHGAHDLDRAWHIQYQMCGLIWSCFHKLLQRGESSQVERVNNLSFMLENRRRSLSSIERPSFNIFVHPADGISPRVPWDNAHSEIGQIQYWLTGKSGTVICALLGKLWMKGTTQETQNHTVSISFLSVSQYSQSFSLAPLSWFSLFALLHLGTPTWVVDTLLFPFCLFNLVYIGTNGLCHPHRTREVLYLLILCAVSNHHQRIQKTIHKDRETVLCLAFLDCHLVRDHRVCTGLADFRWRWRGVGGKKPGFLWYCPPKEQ